MPKHTDNYSTLAELKAHEKLGSTYSIDIKDRQSWATIVSPHGGTIEHGTSDLARLIAGSEYNLYDFEALADEGAKRLHVTSAHFSDADLTALLKSSRVCVSVHGRKQRGDDSAWIGGNNKQLSELIVQALSKKGIQSKKATSELTGTDTKNFVNQAKEAGVQLELPPNLRRDTADGITTNARQTVAEAVREALKQYESQSK
jgi:phage replication-related protein YjqB (UPF0714/DUF867 family)